MPTQSAKPWYRQFWPWFIMLPPAGAVIGGFVSFFLAGGPPSLVVDDYGKIAMVTAQRATRDKLASELGLGARIEISRGDDDSIARLSIRLDGIQPAAGMPDYLHLRLIHPTLEALDSEAMLAETGGRYTGTISRADSRLYLQLTDSKEVWRLTGELRPEDTVIELTARSTGQTATGAQ